MNKATATFAGGCFWCTEAIFTRLKGVISVMPGYAGGTVPNPTYEQVCTGNTGHAETIQIDFDADKISFDLLLDIFWHTHNPTTLNQQGEDRGTQYRSVIFYHDQKQKEAAENSKAELTKSRVYPDPIVTEIIPFTNFYRAENYHRDYFAKNSRAPYCNMVIDPKIRKLLTDYRREIKKKFLEKL